jgi:general stress protein 26
MSDKEPSEHIWKLMQDIGFCMVVTHSGEGDAVRARPMAAKAEIDDHAIYFLTDAGAPKDHEIKHNSNVCLTFSDVKANNYVSVSGTAEVFADSELAGRVWSAGDKAFFKDSDDPKIRIIRVTPDQGEYWEGVGMIAKVVKMIAASASGGRPDLGKNRKVAM